MAHGLFNERTGHEPKVKCMARPKYLGPVNISLKGRLRRQAINLILSKKVKALGSDAPLETKGVIALSHTIQILARISPNIFGIYSASHHFEI